MTFHPFDRISLIQWSISSNEKLFFAAKRCISSGHFIYMLIILTTFIMSGLIVVKYIRLIHNLLRNRVTNLLISIKALTTKMKDRNKMNKTKTTI